MLRVVVHVQPHGVLVVERGRVSARGNLLPGYGIPGHLDHRKTRVEARQVLVHVDDFDAHAVVPVALQMEFVAPDPGLAPVLPDDDGRIRGERDVVQYVVMEV